MTLQLLGHRIGCVFRGVNLGHQYAPLAYDSIPAVSQSVTVAWVNWQAFQIRWYAARKGKRMLKNLAKRKAKVEKIVKEEVFVPYHVRLAEKTAIAKRSHTNKSDVMKPEPVDDVYSTKDYKEKVYSVVEAIQMHRETHHPTMCNEPNAILNATLELDMTSGIKKKKYLDNFRGTIAYPHEFRMDTRKQIIAICKGKMDQEMALNAGAFMTGGTELIKRIHAKEIKTDEFDHLVVHPDILQELVSIRGLLKKHFPTKSKGNLGTDMPRLVQHFLKGVDYFSAKDKYEESFGWVDIPIGRLDMKTETLEENAVVMLNNIQTHSVGAKVSKQFITRAVLWSLPSEEKFPISFWNHIEGYREPGVSEIEEPEEFDGRNSCNTFVT